MADSVPIVPGLTFPEQVQELASFFVRTQPNEQARDQWIAEISSQLQLGNEQEEVSQEQRQKAVEALVKGVVEGNGAIVDGTEREVESSHLLLDTVLLSTFDQSSDKFTQIYKQVVDAIVKGSEQASNGNKSAQKGSEVAFKVLTNAYNLLPTSSSLRSTILLELLKLLSHSTTLDLSALPLTTALIEQSLAEWTSISSADKVQWLHSVAEIYESSASHSVSRSVALKQGLELRILALHVAENKSGVDSVIVKALSIPEVFDLSDILRVQGAREACSEELKQVVKMIETEEVALEAALKYVQDSKSALEAKGLSSTDVLAKKLRLLALITLCAKSESREISYATVADALKVDIKQVESWVIDAIRLNLLKARLSQPKQSLHIQSVHSRSFGPSDWSLLEKRLGEWKSTVDEVRSVVDDAIAKAAASEAETAGGRAQRQRRERGERQQQQQSQGETGQDQKQQVAA